MAKKLAINGSYQDDGVTNLTVEAMVQAIKQRVHTSKLSAA